DDRFVMFLGDNVIQGGIGQLLGDFADRAWNSQIVLKEVEKPSAYAVAKRRPDGSIEKLIQTPPAPRSNLALVAVYMYDPQRWEAVNSIPAAARGEYEITDAIQWLIDAGLGVYPHIHKGWWIDAGKLTDMLEANSLVLEEVTPTISPDAFIERSQLDRRVTVEA